jgi:hypothetical protein
MTEILTVQVVTAMPSRKYPLGAVELGHYTEVDGVVSLVTKGGTQRTNSSGKPIQQKLVAGDDASDVAKRLTKRHLPPKQSDFNRPLYYPKRGKI